MDVSMAVRTASREKTRPACLCHRQLPLTTPLVKRAAVPVLLKTPMPMRRKTQKFSGKHFQNVPLWRRKRRLRELLLLIVYCHDLERWLLIVDEKILRSAEVVIPVSILHSSCFHPCQSPLHCSFPLQTYNFDMGIFLAVFLLPLLNWHDLINVNTIFPTYLPFYQEIAKD